MYYKIILGIDTIFTKLVKKKNYSFFIFFALSDVNILCYIKVQVKNKKYCFITYKL